MPTVFDSHFAATAFPALLSQFGESITYYPNGGGSRKIEAIIEREPPSVFDAAGNAVLPSAIVRVHNSCRSGIGSDELNAGRDELSFPLKIGDAIPKRFSVMQIISSNAGVTRLAVR